MRRTCLVLLCLLGGSTAAAEDWAVAMLDHTSHDFGVVARGAKIEHRFTLENIYLEDVHISSIRSNCRCTSMICKKRKLKTYEKTEIVAILNTRENLGRKDATVTVTFDQPFAAEVQLHIYSYIRSDVVMQPGAVHFGSVDQGTSVRSKISLSYAGRDNWKIIRVEQGNPHLEVLLKEVGRGQTQVTYDLWVKLKADAPPGYFRDHVMLITNDTSTRASRFPLTVEGNVVAAFAVRPSSLFLGVLKPGQTVTKQLVVQGNQPFQIVDASSTDQHFQFKLPNGLKKVHLIPVTYTADETPGKVTGVIHIQTGRTGGPVLRVPTHVQITAPTEEIPEQ